MLIIGPGFTARAYLIIKFLENVPSKSYKLKWELLDLVFECLNYFIIYYLFENYNFKYILIGNNYFKTVYICQ